MKLTERRWRRGLRQLLAAMRPEHAPQVQRIVSMQLHIVMPARALELGT